MLNLDLQPLNLDLQPLSLNPLGLTVTLQEFKLVIVAVRGPRNLLGNLVCAIAGLLNPGGFLGGLLPPPTSSAGSSAARCPRPAA